MSIIEDWYQRFKRWENSFIHNKSINTRNSQSSFVQEYEDSTPYEKISNDTEIIFNKMFHSRLKYKFKRKYKDNSWLFGMRSNFTRSAHETNNSNFWSENMRSTNSDEISQLQKTWEHSVKRLTQLYSSMSNFKESMINSRRSSRKCSSPLLNK